MGTTVSATVVNGSNLHAAVLGRVDYSADEGVHWSEGSYIPGNVTITTLLHTGGALYAGTDGSGVYRSLDEGVSWVEASSGMLNLDVHSLLSTSMAIYAGTTGGVFKSVDNGSNWIPINQGLSSVEVQALAISGSSLFAAGSGIFRSDDGGTNWVQMSTGSFKNLSVVGTTIFAGGQGQELLRSMDNGNTWSIVNSGLGLPCVMSFAANGPSLFVTTCGQGILASTDNGDNWTPINNDLLGSSANLVAVNGSNIFAGMSHYGIWKRELNSIFAGVKESPKMGEVRIAPNPTSGSVTLYAGGASNISSIELFDITGQQLFRGKWNLTSDELTYDLIDRDNGLYFVEVKFSDGHRIVQKLIKE
ncbi:MAG: T9SS type A sorting domain-containing protein [Flavobacteriales bacterium]|nr:T9SS type A sorting domain-containing protein [Flavobacteriales bacterium]MBK9058958.1 T9SS type A sorting domain-containing protein [Flavobacteriales bacterium]